jgi:hypothetical protein
MRHDPVLALLALAGAGLSKLLLPRAYRCPACGHTFSA